MKHNYKWKFALRKWDEQPIWKQRRCVNQQENPKYAKQKTVLPYAHKASYGVPSALLQGAYRKCHIGPLRTVRSPAGPPRVWTHGPRLPRSLVPLLFQWHDKLYASKKSFELFIKSFTFDVPPLMGPYCPNRQNRCTVTMRWSHAYSTHNSPVTNGGIDKNVNCYFFNHSHTSHRIIAVCVASYCQLKLNYYQYLSYS